MRLSKKGGDGIGVLAENLKVFLNGKLEKDVLLADNLLGYVDVPYKKNDVEFTVKRKFGSIVFKLDGKDVRDQELFKKERK